MIADEQLAAALAVCEKATIDYYDNLKFEVDVCAGNCVKVFARHSYEGMRIEELVADFTLDGKGVRNASLFCDAADPTTGYAAVVRELQATRAHLAQMMGRLNPWLEPDKISAFLDEGQAYLSEDLEWLAAECRAWAGRGEKQP